MLKMVIYGKGGIGKSTVAACLSASWALHGKKVLHVGCDPKHDSTLVLLDGRKITTIAELLLAGMDRVESINEFMVTGRLGIDCVEAGGPDPGIGCAGRGIARMFDIFEDVDLFARSYDAALFDVLGDVVCGGFAGPLRQGYGDTVIIVVSEEFMSLYAANNVCRVVTRYQKNGAKLAGIVMNRRDNQVDPAPVQAFAERIGARILGILPRDPAIRSAEMAGKTVVEMFPESEPAAVMHRLASDLENMPRDAMSVPRPMSDEDFRDFVRSFQH